MKLPFWILFLSLPLLCEGAFTSLDLATVFNEQHQDVWDPASTVLGHGYYESGCNAWFSSAAQTLDGIPFTVGIHGFDALSGSPKGIESYEIPVNAPARAIFLLGGGAGLNGFTNDLNQFNIEIVYDDGSTEEQLPINTISHLARWYDNSAPAGFAVASFASGGQWGDAIGVNSYTTRLFTYMLLPAQPAKPIRALYFHDHSRTGEFALFAVTLADAVPARLASYAGNVVRREHPATVQPSSSTRPLVSSGSYALVDLTDYYNVESASAISLGYGVSRAGSMALDPGFNGPDYQLEGVPFRVTPTGRNGVASSLKGLESYTFSIGRKARAIHLLMSAHIDLDNVSAEEADPNYVDRYDYFMTEIRYKDGTMDRVFPFHPASGTRRVWQHQGSQVLYHYVVEPPRDAEIESFTIRDGYDQAGYVLYGLTLDTGAFNWAEPALPPRVREVAAPAPRAATVTVSGDEATLENDILSVTLEGLQNARPLRIKALRNKFIDRDCLAAPSYPFILYHSYGTVATGRDTFAPDQFQVSSVTTAGGDPASLRFKLTPTGRSDFYLEAACSLSPGAGLLFDLKFVNQSDRQVSLGLFPMIANVRIGASAQDDENFFPPQQGFWHNGPIDARISYGGHCYMPLLDVSDPLEGGGLTFFVGDPQAQSKIVTMRKLGVTGTTITADGTYMPQGGPHRAGVLTTGSLMSVEMWDGLVAPRADWVMPTAHLIPHASDWHAAWLAYRAWMKTNYPDHTIPESLRRVFYASGGHNTTCHDGAQYSFASFLPEVDFIQMFGWWNYPGNPRAGNDDEYSYRSDWGGATSFNTASQAMAAKSTQVSLYLEGFLLHFNWGTWGKALTADQSDDPALTNSRASHIEVPAGTAYGGMCPGALLWVQFYKDMAHRLVREAGVRGIYLDSITNGPPVPCYNAAHHHATAVEYNRDVAHLIRDVRLAVREENPEAFVHAESLGTDLTASELDCAHVYYRHGPGWPRRTTGGLMHFFFPGRKFIGLSTFDYHVAEARLAAFYGDAINTSMMGVGPTALSPYRRTRNPYLDELALAMKPLWRQLTSEAAWPHLPTEHAGLRANRFEAVGQPTVYTLYNDNPYTLHGRMLQIGPATGGVREAVTGKTLAVEQADGHWYLRADIDPGQVMIAVLSASSSVTACAWKGY